MFYLDFSMIFTLSLIASASTILILFLNVEDFFSEIKLLKKRIQKVLVIFIVSSITLYWIFMEFLKSLDLI